MIWGRIFCALGRHQWWPVTNALKQWDIVIMGPRAVAICGRCPAKKYEWRDPR